ncbi:MAG TPA: ATP-binding protein [Gemmatimonadales bacterium]|nr:ATP-binding protein [Gemmatimonadales bacterium]
MVELTLVVEMVLVAAMICGLYELRGRFGLTPLYIFLASLQYLQALLGGAVFLHIAGGIAVSPGSVALFSGNLFALLLIYLREGVPATRTLVYGVLLANFTLGIFSAFTQFQLGLAGTSATQVVPFEFFGVSYRAFGVGVVVMLLDGLLMIVLYELLFFQLTWAPLLLRLLVALLGVLYFDSVMFGIMSYWGRPDFRDLLTGNMAGKSIAGVTYAILLWVYLDLSARTGPRPELERPRELRDVFSIITYRERYERMAQALAASEERLRQAQLMEAVGRLASGIAHDFGNILTAIESYAALLQERLAGDHPGREEVNGIREGSARGKGLIRQLLTIGKRQPLAPRTLELAGVVLGMEGMLRTVLGAKYRLETRIGDGIPLVAADPGQMEQVLLNLVVNARDAMPAGGTIRVLLEARDLRGMERVEAGTPKPGRYAVLTVEDSGAGIGPETMEHVFEPFYTTKGSVGSGLGLSIVYGIVTQSDGVITVESAPGAGSRFSIHIPEAPVDFRTPPPLIPTAARRG